MASACKATCTIVSDSGNNVWGHLSLTQADSGAQVQIEGTLTGLTPGKHGISVCVSGDLSQGSASCGPVFNPFGKTHGAPTDDNRMVGDLGNIFVNDSGTATVAITDPQVQLLGPHSVIGRSIIVYAGEDDQGRGGHESSVTTGNPGPRIAAGVIGLSV